MVLSVNSRPWHLGAVCKCWEWSQVPQLRHVSRRSHCRYILLTHLPMYFLWILDEKLQGLGLPGLLMLFYSDCSTKTGPHLDKVLLCCCFVWCCFVCWVWGFLIFFLLWMFGVFFYSIKKWNLTELEILESSQQELFCYVLLLLLLQWIYQGKNIGYTSLLQCCTKALG